MTIENKTIQEHIKNQESLRANLGEIIQKLNNKYYFDKSAHHSNLSEDEKAAYIKYQEQKNQFQAFLKQDFIQKLSQLQNQEKIALKLVDLQNEYLFERTE